MSKRKKPETEHYDDPLDLCAFEEWGNHPATLPIPTGLNDEDDAVRFLGLRFNPDARFCPNCEVIYDTPPHSWCDRCGLQLKDVGHPAIKTRHKERGA